MNKLPIAQTKNIVVQTLGKELLIYDLKTHQAYQLNETSMIVFEACSEGKTFEDLKRKHRFTDDLIYLTLDMLAKENLLSGEYQSQLAGVSRREAIRKVGLATMTALPVIAALAAPKAADAVSRRVNQCAAIACADGGPGNGGGCNPPNGCGVLGLSCCAAFNTCTCAPANVCTDNGGQVCP